MLNAAAANAGGSTQLRTENNFAMLGANNVGTYSGTDSVINTAALVQNIPTNVQQIAESLLNTNGAARANAEIQSNTAITATVVVGPGGVITLSFQADPDQQAQINSALPGSFLAQSNMTASFTLSDANGNSVSWSPQGTAANDCSVNGFVGVTCGETADGADLNFNKSTASNPGNSVNSFEAGDVDLFNNFGITISGLAIGEYTIALNTLTSTSIRRTVPEPATTGLIGVALAGLGLSAMRRKRKQG